MSADILPASAVIDRLFEIQGVLRLISASLDHISPPDRQEIHTISAVGRSADLCVAILDDLVESLEDIELILRKSA